MNIIWNEDGTPRKPEPGRGEEVNAFADLSANPDDERQFVSYAALQAAAKAATPAGVGDIVHYWTEYRCVAAIITDAPVIGDAYCLTRFDVDEMPESCQGVLHSETKEDKHTWHWPESL